MMKNDAKGGGTAAATGAVPSPEVTISHLISSSSDPRNPQLILVVLTSSSPRHRHRHPHLTLSILTSSS